MKIGLITLHSSYNYGAVLQCYALQCVLERLGHKVVVVNRKWGRYGKRMSRLRVLCQNIKGWLQLDRFTAFRLRYLNLSPLIQSRDDIINVTSDLEALVVGSDQVWNFDCIPEMDYFYYLDWPSNNIMKYSYAASFGKDNGEIDEYSCTRIKNAFESFSGISVREQSGVVICKEKFGIESRLDLDPTLLLDRNHYLKFCSNVKTHEPNLCVYFLDKTEDKFNLAQYIAKKNNYKIINNLPADYRKRLSVNKWIENIAKSDFVVTDSYHGMVFSIIFRKQFVVYRNTDRGSTRFDSLLNTLRIHKRIVDSFQVYDIDNIEKIDYSKVSHILNIECEKSISYLKSL